MKFFKLFAQLFTGKPAHAGTAAKPTPKTKKSGVVKKTGLTVGMVAALGGSYQFGNRSEDHLATLCPAPVQLARCMITKTPHDFGIIQSYRSQEYQNRLYAQGRTTAGQKVTWTLNSRHTSGLAFDIMAYVDGEHTWDPQYYKDINEAAAKACSIELDIPYVWGGTFKNSKGKLLGDWGHFETKSCTVEKQKVDI